MFNIEQSSFEEYTSNIGKQYLDSSNRVCTVVDVRFTFNSKGHLELVRYVSKHSFLGQDVYDYDVRLTTIFRRAIQTQGTEIVTN